MTGVIICAPVVALKFMITAKPFDKFGFPRGLKKSLLQQQELYEPGHKRGLSELLICVEVACSRKKITNRESNITLDFKQTNNPNNNNNPTRKAIGKHCPIGIGPVSNRGVGISQGTSLPVRGVMMRFGWLSRRPDLATK